MYSMFWTDCNDVYVVCYVLMLWFFWNSNVLHVLSEFPLIGGGSGST